MSGRINRKPLDRIRFAAYNVEHQEANKLKTQQSKASPDDAAKKCDLCGTSPAWEVLWVCGRKEFRQHLCEKCDQQEIGFLLEKDDDNEEVC
ncbi:MAG: hypothetical protein ACK4JF_08430 [Methylohalobius sp.]